MSGQPFFNFRTNTVGTSQAQPVQVHSHQVGQEVSRNQNGSGSMVDPTIAPQYSWSQGTSGGPNVSQQQSQQPQQLMPMTSQHLQQNQQNQQNQQSQQSQSQSQQSLGGSGQQNDINSRQIDSTSSVANSANPSAVRSNRMDITSQAVTSSDTDLTSTNSNLSQTDRSGQRSTHSMLLGDNSYGSVVDQANVDTSGRDQVNLMDHQTAELAKRFRYTQQAGTISPVPSDSSSPRSRRQLATSKRAAQNREAQRAFRQRKEQYIKDLQAQVSELKVARSTINALRNENMQLRDYILALQSRLIDQPGNLPPPPSAIVDQFTNSGGAVGSNGSQTNSRDHQSRDNNDRNDNVGLGNNANNAYVGGPSTVVPARRARRAHNV